VAADAGVVQHVNPRLRGAGLLSSGKHAWPASTAAGLGALQATRLQNSLGAYKRAGGPAGAVRRGPSAAAVPAAPDVRGSSNLRGRCQHRMGGRCAACAGAFADDTHVEFSSNPLAARSALAFAPTTAGVGGSTAWQLTRRPDTRTAPAAPHHSQPGAPPSGRGRGVTRARRPLTHGERGLRAGSPDSASVSSATTSTSSRSSGSSTGSERAAARARARARLDISALRRKSRVELRAVPASTAQPRTASDVAAGLNGQRARGAPAAVSESAAATAATDPPHGVVADSAVGAPKLAGHGGEVGDSGRACAGVPAGAQSQQRRAVNLGAGSDKRDGTAGGAAPGLRDLRSYRATSVRSLRTALG
jgi:hypothetical protein